MSRDTQFINPDYDKYKIPPVEGGSTSPGEAAISIAWLWDQIQQYISTMSIIVAGIEVTSLVVNDGIEIKSPVGGVTFVKATKKWKVYPDETTGILLSEDVSE